MEVAIYLTLTNRGIIMSSAYRYGVTKFVRIDGLLTTWKVTSNEFDFFVF